MIERNGYSIFEVGDVIPMTPTDPPSINVIRQATVVYIHPEGRFYTIRFDCPGGSFRETRNFTPQELESCYALGIFPRPVEVVLDMPGLHRRPERKPPRNRVEEPDFYDEDYGDDISDILAMG